jgi:hypothetical protein
MTTKKSKEKKTNKSKKKVISAKGHASSKATQALEARHLSSVSAEIKSQRSKASGRIPRGEIAKVLKANKPIYTWLTIDIIKKH